MRSRLAAAAMAALVAAVYLAIGYGFFHYLWPRLPPWLSLLGFIALAVAAIGSPLLWLLRLSR